MTITDDPATDSSVLGSRVLRKEDPVLLTGEAVFTNDMKVPGALHPDARHPAEGVAGDQRRRIVTARASSTRSAGPGSSLHRPTVYISSSTTNSQESQQ